MKKFYNNLLLSEAEIDRIFELKANHDIFYIKNKLALCILNKRKDLNKDYEYNPEEAIYKSLLEELTDKETMLKESQMRSYLERYLYNKVRSHKTGKRLSSVSTKNLELLKLDSNEFEENKLTEPLKNEEQILLFLQQKDFYLRDRKLNSYLENYQNASSDGINLENNCKSILSTVKLELSRPQPKLNDDIIKVELIKTLKPMVKRCEKFPVYNTNDHNIKRENVWMKMDTNKNGILDYPEV